MAKPICKLQSFMSYWQHISWPSYQPIYIQVCEGYEPDPQACVNLPEVKHMLLGHHTFLQSKNGRLLISFIVGQIQHHKQAHSYASTGQHLGKFKWAFFFSIINSQSIFSCLNKFHEFLSKYNLKKLGQCQLHNCYISLGTSPF